MKQESRYESTFGRDGPGVLRTKQWLGYDAPLIDGTHIDPQTNKCHAGTVAGRVLMHPGDWIITINSGNHYVVLKESFKRSVSLPNNECQCNCHFGGYDGAGVCKQPCDLCDCDE